MAGRYLLVCVIIALLGASCTRGEKPAGPARKQRSLVIVKTKPRTLTGEQRAELAFPEEMIREVETAADAEAEPFFVQVMSKSANLKGDIMISTGRLSGFSVRTASADEVITRLSRSLRSRGYLIFRSAQNFGSVPDVVTVVRGSSSYDILRVQQTGSVHYRLDTKTIIRWLRNQQRSCAFVVTGAGADWVEARFIRPPRDMETFARKVASFSPDVLREGPRTVKKLAAWMEETNGFRLFWD